MNKALKGLRTLFLITAACSLLTGCLHRADLQPFAGQWVLRASGKNMVVLNTNVRTGKLVGTLAHPKHFTEGPTGKFSAIHPPIVTEPVVGKWKKGSAEFVFGQKPDRTWISVPKPRNGSMLLNYFHGYVPAWKLNKVPSEPKIKVATDWPAGSPDSN